MRGLIVNIDKLVFRIAGIMIVISVVLAYSVNIYWLLLTAFVGLNMLQASFTGFCPLAKILAKMGVASGCAFK
jgi:hypothetical protein